MILLSILILMAIFLLVFTVIAVALGGSLALIVFGDVIVCIVFIVLIVKAIIGKKNKRR